MSEFSTPLFIKDQCLLFPRCSGCQNQTSAVSQSAWQEIHKFALSEGVQPNIFQDALWKWRRRAKLAVRGKATVPQIGLFQAGTHQVVDMPNCPMHHPAIDNALRIFRTSMIAFNIKPYNESNGQGDVRYVQFQVQNDTVQLSIVLNHKTIPDALRPWLEFLSKEPSIFSLWINFQERETNTIFGEKWSHYSGEYYLWENIGRRNLCFHPACFSQAHTGAFNLLIKSVQEKVLKGKNLLELYAGVGALGLNLIEECKSVAMREINPLSVSCFENSYPNRAENVDFQIRDALACLDDMNTAEILLVDPPRKGLPLALVQQANQSPSLEQIIYVSCHFPSFHRDCENLSKEWKLSHLEGYLFFPGTHHIEVLGIFEKRN